MSRFTILVFSSAFRTQHFRRVAQTHHIKRWRRDFSQCRACRWVAARFKQVARGRRRRRCGKRRAPLLWRLSRGTGTRPRRQGGTRDAVARVVPHGAAQGVGDEERRRQGGAARAVGGEVARPPQGVDAAQRRMASVAQGDHPVSGAAVGVPCKHLQRVVAAVAQCCSRGRWERGVKPVVGELGDFWDKIGARRIRQQRQHDFPVDKKRHVGRRVGGQGRIDHPTSRLRTVDAHVKPIEAAHDGGRCCRKDIPITWPVLYGVWYHSRCQSRCHSWRCLFNFNDVVGDCETVRAVQCDGSTGVAFRLHKSAPVDRHIRKWLPNRDWVTLCLQPQAHRDQCVPFITRPYSEQPD